MRAGFSALCDRKRKRCNLYVSRYACLVRDYDLRVLVHMMLAFPLSLCLHVAPLTVINLMWEKEVNNWMLLNQYSLLRNFWKVLGVCCVLEFRLVRKQFNSYPPGHVLVFSSFLHVCTVGSGYSISLLTSPFLLQTGMILRDCIKCIGLKYDSNVASMFDKASWQTYLAFVLVHASNFRSKIQVIWCHLCLEKNGLLVWILYYKRKNSCFYWTKALFSTY